MAKKTDRILALLGLETLKQKQETEKIIAKINKNAYKETFNVPKVTN